MPRKRTHRSKAKAADVETATIQLTDKQWLIYTLRIEMACRDALRSDERKPIADNEAATIRQAVRNPGQVSGARRFPGERIAIERSTLIWSRVQSLLADTKHGGMIAREVQMQLTAQTIRPPQETAS